MYKQVLEFRVSAVRLRRAMIVLVALGVGVPPVMGEVLEPSNVFLTSYNAAVLNNVGVANTRANAFTILTNGVIQQTALSDRIDTWNHDDANTSPEHTAYDFVGLQYDGAKRFDNITIHLSPQFGDGGDWEAVPKVYILKNPTLVGGEVDPQLSPSWVELTGVPAPTGHTFSPTAQPYGTTGGSFTFDLSSLPADARTGWGWAVGGVDGNQQASDNLWNFIGLTEVQAEGVAAPVPQKLTASTLRPTNMVANAYHSPGFGGDGFIAGRGLAFKAITNGIIQPGSPDEGFDTFQGDGVGNITDFVGLQYATLNVFDSVTIELGHQFGDGGDWDAKPKVYILKNPVDTDTSAPESDPANWLELDAPEITGHVFSPLSQPFGTPGETLTFDLSGFSTEQRTGWGIAVGGVDGNANAAGIQNFISVTEVLVDGTVIPGPYDLNLQVNRSTGEVKIVNNTNLDIELDFYEITSANGSLDVSASGWNSLEDPSLNTPAFPSGDGSGNGWEVLGAPDANGVGEFYLQGESEMASNTEVSLGNLFAGGTEDLFFRYGVNGALIDAVVEYISGSGLLGDFNNDGVVNAIDYVVWRNNVGQSDAVLGGNGAGTGIVDSDDYLLWKDRYGNSAGSLSVATNQVPEPGTMLLAGLGAAAAMLTLRRRK